MTSAIDVADSYLARLIELDPILGTSLGDQASASALPDFSPEGVDALRVLTDQTLGDLRLTVPASDADRRTRDVLTDVLESESEQHQLHEPLRVLRSFASPIDRLRGAFDLMPRAAAEDWPAVVERMTVVPTAMEGMAASLRQGIALNVVAARRQAAVVAAQARAWGGGGGSPGYFTRLIEAGPPSSMKSAAAAAAAGAEAAMLRFADFLDSEYAPAARDSDAVGRESYAVWARHFNGIELDLDETYAWGWDELSRLHAEIDVTCAHIVPSGDFAQAQDLLTDDPARAIHGVESFRRWLQNLTDRAIDQLDGTQFDLSPEARRLECMIAPPGGGAAMYYTPPTEDWSRPGRTWYPAGERTVFPTWEEVTTAYHEGVPGHHLQAVAVRLSGEPLSRFQKNWFNSGHGEGWALYSERLMDELGYHERPDTRLGMLVASAFRAARVILDLGLHLELSIPAGADFHPGEPWTYELARTFLSRYIGRGETFVTSEVDRYLGMPGQAISYKVGEREWMDIRREVRARQGADFDLKAFHTRALEIGPMGLAQLRRELTQLSA